MEAENNMNGVPPEGDHNNEDSSSMTGAAARIKTLDRLTATSLRKCQVINKVSDIVRELVENSLDADATTIQVYLEKYGRDKIEVRDNGYGFIPSDVQQIFQGGCTTKLLDTSNLTRGKFLGFKGEALNAMCAVGNVTVISKTKESEATKYTLNVEGKVVSETKAAHKVGTTITVEKLFENIRVRRQRFDSTATASNELKEIEVFLKGAGIAYPKCHISCYHDTQSVWSKPSVSTMEQALVTVLGHNIAKRLRKCGPIVVNGENDIDPHESNVLRSVELYVPVKPVDMRTMSYTSNKMAMIFCNKKRVYIRDIEKLIHRYIVACVDKPQPADQRRHPVSVLCIEVPPKEADFNLDMDKSKVFLTCKDMILATIEEALIKFYEINLRHTNDTSSNIVHGVDVEDSDTSLSSSASSIAVIRRDLDATKLNNDNDINKKCLTETDRTNTESVSVPILKPSLSSQSSRQSTINDFLQDIPSTSSAFAQSPLKFISSEPVAVSFPTSKVNVSVPVRINTPINELDLLKKPGESAVANFNISIDSQGSEMDYSTISSVTSATLADGGMEIPGKYEDWLHGRITDKFGDIIENVVPVTENATGNCQDCDKDRFCTALFCGRRTASLRGEQQSSISSSSNAEPPLKRHKYDESPTILSAGIPFLVPRMPTHKQTTLDSLTSWQTPTGVFSQPASNTVVGVRIPLTPNRFKTTSETNVSVSGRGVTHEKSLVKSVNAWEHEQRPFREQLNVLTPALQVISTKFKTTIPGHKQVMGKSTPRIHKEFQGSSIGPLYIAQTYDSIGVFSPYNMMKYFPSESTECRSSMTDGNFCETVSLSLDDVSKMFQRFVTRSDINNTPSASKIFHTISKLPNLMEVINV